MFRPGKLPIKPGNIYSARGDAERNFKKTLRRGLIPLVYGEYGVGKTTMARYALREVEAQGLLVNIENVANKSLADVFAACLEKIGYTVDVERTSTDSEGVALEQSGEANAGISWLKAKILAKRTKETKQEVAVRSEFVVTSPTDSRFIAVCEEHGIYLLIDEMHRASDEFVEDFSSFIKAYGNASCERFKIAVLGTTSDAARLVLRDPGVDRLIEEVHLESMSTPERQFLVTQGMQDLAIQIDSHVVEKLCAICVGSPNILQWLCLESAEAAFDRDPRRLDLDDVMAAVNEYAEKKQSRLYRAYMAAIENKGEIRFRKQILRAMSESENEYVTMDEIRDRVNTYVTKQVESTDLSGPLRRLKEKEYGPVLQDVQRSDSGSMIQNYTTFVDPALKAYIRMLVAREAPQ